ncbi:hypothetical protein SODALDRAFT_288166 [Sodiomyces alkalinus F11]|uniref:PH domain-containing protein n=1 Tax=Sodiomyces alkalinus (strain CBS 110278 / VKM F-3762 / F11) TaxID=1314773 RepID=A0A3N2Q7G9_SODAK|nr:hypothetical protein SODALDRAFT_288166 [Sodiomyces alkalinus F11]ROT42714.1 hypothetical protein SODALDRAFT_288166 [Sodiomyces alkalinus F11]
MASKVTKTTLHTRSPDFDDHSQLVSCISANSKLNPNANIPSSNFPPEHSYPDATEASPPNQATSSHLIPRWFHRDNRNSNSNNNHHSSTQAPNPGKFTEEWNASQRGASIIDGSSANMQRPNSYHGSQDEDHISLPSRGNTLKKKSSLRRNASLGRNGSRRSMKAGSVRSLALQSASDPDEANSAFHCPVPTAGNPTEVLANRFNAWRKILKDLIAYYREIQSHYEAKAKSILKVANVANNIAAPAGFLASGGLDDAMDILRTYHKNAILEANKAKEIEEDVILALTGLRSDLQQKIKEIKSLSGDFKNSVEKEMDNTRKAVKALQDTIGQSDLDPSLATGKQDPYLLRLAVDRQVELQIDEENYLHQAYLNLETSGRELESIVVGEIQKAYNAYAGILKRESDAAYNAIDELRIGPISMPKDREWTYFVQKDDQFVDPDVPVRSAEQIHYPGQDHESCQEIRAGLLERKSKYLKSYTAGWYVLSPTHLHEFKSADKTQAPVMSLYLPEQKLGSHSSEGGSSNKFILKGRQAGSMHRGHTWVFRAETHDTMMAWYEDVKALTEKTPQERSEYVRHTRSLSQSSRRSISSDAVVDEEDEEPFSAEAVIPAETDLKQDIRRPEPGGRFPSDIQVNAQRDLQAPLSPSSMSSRFDNRSREADGMVGFIPQNSQGRDYYTREAQDNHRGGYGNTSHTPMEESPSHAAIVSQQAREDGVNPYTNEPFQRSQFQIDSSYPYHPSQPSQPDMAFVGETQRSQNRQSYGSHASQRGTRDQSPAVQIMADGGSQQTNPTWEPGAYVAAGVNAQDGQPLNDKAYNSSNRLQAAHSGEYNYPSEDRSTGDISKPPVITTGGQHNDVRGYPPNNEPRSFEGSVSSPVHGDYYPTAAFPDQNVPNGRPMSMNVRTNSIPHIPGEYPNGNTPTMEKLSNRVL